MKKATTTNNSKRKQEFMDRLRKTPKEKLSPVAKYWLEHENDEGKWVIYDMRAVLK